MSAQQTVDGAFDFVCSLRLHDGRRWGDIATSWQRAAVLDALYDTVRLYAFWTRPRGGSKTTDVAAIALAVMLMQAPAGAMLYVIAADKDQGALVIQSIREFALNTPGLAAVLKIDAFTVTVVGSEIKLTVLAADAPGTWGLRPYWVAVDELAQWRETKESIDLYDAIRTALPKRRARMIVCTTPGDPEHFAREIRDHAEVDELWNLHEVPGPLPYIDNVLLAAQERELSPSRYARLHLGQWAEPESRLATREDVLACRRNGGTLAPARDVVYVVGVDLGIKHDRTAAAVCHMEERQDGSGTSATTIVVDHINTWQAVGARAVSLADVQKWLVETARAYNGAWVILEPWQSAGMSQALFNKSILSKEAGMSSREISERASLLYTLIRQRRIEIPDDEELLHELARVELREPSPGLLRLDHRQGDHDDRAIAIALAAGLLMTEGLRLQGPRCRVLTALPPPSGLGGRW